MPVQFLGQIFLVCGGSFYCTPHCWDSQTGCLKSLMFFEPEIRNMIIAIPVTNHILLISKVLT